MTHRCPFMILICMIFLIGCDASSSNSDDNPNETDENTPCPQVTIYADADRDGFGDANASLSICETDDLPEGYVDNRSDCNDNHPDIYPGANGVDDCNTIVNVSDATQLQDALSTATAGTTINIAPGTYMGAFKVDVSGDTGRPITIKGPADRSAILDGNFNVESWQGVLTIESRHNIIVENLEIRNTRSSRYGVLVGATAKTTDGCHDVVLNNLHVHDVGEEIIKIQGRNTRDILVENCIVHTNQDWSAIDVQGHWGGTPAYDEKPKRIVIRDNLIYDAVAFAGVGNEYADNIQVYNNVVLGCRMGLDIGCGNFNIIHNNLITSYTYFNRLKDDNRYSAIDLSRYPKFSSTQIDNFTAPVAMDGIALSGNYMSLIFDNEVVDCTGNGDLILSYEHRISDGQSHNSVHGHKGNLFFRNKIHDNDAYYTIREYDKQEGGVSYDEMYFNNLFYNNRSSQNIIFENSKGLMFFNNTIVNGDHLNLMEGSNNALIKNNNFINSGYDVASDSTGADIGPNHIGTDTGIFANYSNNDYHLAATYGASPIDSGVDLSAILKPIFAAYENNYTAEYRYYEDFSIEFDFLCDLDGNTHDVDWDMGAFASPKEVRRLDTMKFQSVTGTDESFKTKR